MTSSAVFSLVFIAASGATAPPGSQAAPASPRAANQRYYGVNLSAAAFAPEVLPGVPGRTYHYPDRQVAEPFSRMGMNTIRLPVLWERLQPSPMAPLDAAEAARLDAAIAALGDFGTVILDVHNYARYRGVPLDKMDRGGEALADLWAKMATRYAENPRVAFGLMNEPHDIAAIAWRKMVDRSIAAIRQAGAGQLILVPGVRWTGGAAWLEGGSDSSGSAMAGLHDPADNFLFEIHQYFDLRSSGTSSRCVSATIGRERLTAVTTWLRKERAGGFLAEFGSSADRTCLAALDQTLGFMVANGDVWRGWTYWAAGDWWGDYPFSIQPVGGKARPQTAVLNRYVMRFGPPAPVVRRTARSRE